ncbi:hypothetical protein PENANT_c023G02689 [Penicillium antarcticum]|uniref:Uncharacterized protein n=1 Tax=Penicillium antarcticum TaxID=416450 RepID=A0A1V6PZD6_9EURO|nr:hypothetical protein PENANT_c023G02689 [Penicillium antarcticum]
MFMYKSKRSPSSALNFQGALPQTYTDRQMLGFIMGLSIRSLARTREPFMSSGSHVSCWAWERSDISRGMTYDAAKNMSGAVLMVVVTIYDPACICALILQLHYNL